MISFALAFVSGVFCLQQMPVLPSLMWGWLIFPVTAIAVLLRQKFPTSRAVYQCVLILAVFLVGFFWAALLAAIRLSDALPESSENVPVEIVGIVASPSEIIHYGERFRFDVEQVLTEGMRVPGNISLAYYTPGSYGKAPDPSVRSVRKFHAGERWRITARLKRPHGVQNPYGFDFEAWALSENIRATGSIKAKADHQKLHSFVWRPQYMVQRLRELIQQRIDHVLSGKSYAGVIQALVTGDDSQISASDWDVFLRTGTTHLMSI